MKSFLKPLLGLVGALGVLSIPMGIAFIVAVALIAALAFTIVMVILLRQDASERCIAIIGAWKGGRLTK